MEVEELKALSDEEIAEKLQGLYEESFKLKFRNATSQLENTSRIRQVRRHIARIKTVVGMRSGKGQGV